jgi:hypothetical protein
MKFIELFRSFDDLDSHFLNVYHNQFKEWKKMGIKFVHLIYQEKDLNKVVFFSGTTTDLNQNNSFGYNNHFCFQELFEMFNIKDNHRFNLLVSLYWSYSKDSIINFFTKRLNDENQYLNDLLQSKNGYIVFQDDFEKLLIDKCSFSKDEAHKMKLSWNKKSNAKISLLKDLQFDSKRSIYDVLIQKSILGELSPIVAPTSYNIF